jgi:hypothetical protein
MLGALMPLQLAVVMDCQRHQTALEVDKAYRSQAHCSSLSRSKRPALAGHHNP